MDGIMTDSGDDIAEDFVHALTVSGVLQRAEKAGLQRRVTSRSRSAFRKKD